MREWQSQDPNGKLENPGMAYRRRAHKRQKRPPFLLLIEWKRNIRARPNRNCKNCVRRVLAGQTGTRAPRIASRQPFQCVYVRVWQLINFSLNLCVAREAIRCSIPFNIILSAQFVVYSRNGPRSMGDACVYVIAMMRAQPSSTPCIFICASYSGCMINGAPIDRPDSNLP